MEDPAQRAALLGLYSGLVQLLGCRVEFRCHFSLFVPLPSSGVCGLIILFVRKSSEKGKRGWLERAVARNFEKKKLEENESDLPSGKRRDRVTDTDISHRNLRHQLVLRRVVK
ncbi:hypothetical protein EVAR_93348_1 [Eumeta japonica]|uniref:Uncharacterized protein n=1 Tax=Eumeta variegata TaxID=151549 RepID=A0A4C1USV9_EUMVA|nr:hypothetical protein EVAR_93348_1 [Eumeta japonica]